MRKNKKILKNKKIKNKNFHEHYSRVHNTVIIAFRTTAIDNYGVKQRTKGVA